MPNKPDELLRQFLGFIVFPPHSLKVNIIYAEVFNYIKTYHSCGLGIEDNNNLISCFKYKTLSNSQISSKELKRISELSRTFANLRHLHNTFF